MVNNHSTQDLVCLSYTKQLQFYLLSFDSWGSDPRDFEMQTIDFTKYAGKCNGLVLKYLQAMYDVRSKKYFEMVGPVKIQNTKQSKSDATKPP